MRTGGSMSPHADLNVAREIASGQSAGPDIDATAPYLNGIAAFVAQVQQLRTPEDATRLVELLAQRRQQRPTRGTCT